MIESISDVAKRAAANAAQPRPDLEQLEVERREERRLEELARTRRVSAIPPRYAKATVDAVKVDGRNRPAVDRARSIVSAGIYRTGFGMWGPAGVGKTYIAAGIGNAAIAAGFGAKMFTPEQLFARYFAASSYGGDEAVADLLREVAETPVLILDDFGSEAVSRPKLAFLAEILNARWNADCGTLIVTANMSFADLMDKYVELSEKAGDRERGFAIMDRIRALTGEWVALVGKSQRAFDGDA
jgi:DNA replication protein DnaC